MKKHPVNGARARARSLRRNVTGAERQVWQILRSHRMQGYKFRRQVPIGRYVADFVCHEARLVVEIDGGQHDHSSPQEAERSGFLQDEGYRILRFWNNDVLANLHGVYETIAAELGRITPTQTLPHHKGEGFCQVAAHSLAPHPNPLPASGRERGEGVKPLAPRERGEGGARASGRVRGALDSRA